MKKVLIVDDEFLARLGLKTLIDWEEFGYKIVGEAANGKEALEILDRTDPDILLTDIKMPVMDGLTLIEEVRKRKKNIQIVVLSNHDDFSYAQKAIKFGVTLYILKSELNEANISNLLKNLSDVSYENTEKNADNKTQRENYLKSQLLGKPVDDEFLPSTLSAPPKNLFTDADYFIIRGFCDTSMISENSNDMLVRTIRSIIGKAFSQHDLISFFYKNQFYFTVIADAVSDKQDPVENVKDIMQQLVRNVKQYFDVSVQIGISNIGKPDRFPQMLREAEISRKCCFFTLDSICFYNPDLLQKGSHISISQSKVFSFIEDEKKEEMKEYVSEIFTKLKMMKDYSIYKNAMVDLLAIAKSACEHYELGELPSLPPTKFSYENIFCLPFINSAEEYILVLYETIYDARLSRIASYSPAVRNTIAYIKNNYSKNISLSEAAQMSDLSESYLSLLFKQEVGVNFSTYLTEYRLEIAKKMLKTTNKKIYEISDEIGFSSPYYFSKVFKESTGVTCKEYREKHAHIIENKSYTI